MVMIYRVKHSSFAMLSNSSKHHCSADTLRTARLKNQENQDIILTCTPQPLDQGKDRVPSPRSLKDLIMSVIPGS